MKWINAGFRVPSSQTGETFIFRHVDSKVVSIGFNWQNKSRQRLQTFEWLDESEESLSSPDSHPIEGVEEAAERAVDIAILPPFYPDNEYPGSAVFNIKKDVYREAFIAGAQWQSTQKREEGWISIEDCKKLPPHEQIVLVWKPMVDGTTGLITLAYRYEDDWFQGTRKIEGITHFQYLPKPPQQIKVNQ